MNETGSYPGQPWLWLYTLWYQVPGFDNSANVDLIAIYLTGLATILLLPSPSSPACATSPGSSPSTASSGGLGTAPSRIPPSAGTHPGQPTRPRRDSRNNRFASGGELKPASRLTARGRL